ncbi:MAG TPA: DUF6657 family protein [Rectinemataceae bacterium]
MIKSALELALEKTQGLKVDEAFILAGEEKVEGRRAAGRYLDDPASFNLGAALKGRKPEYREIFRKAAFDVLVAQIQLPNGFFSPEKLEAVGEGIAALAHASGQKGLLGSRGSDKEAVALVQQISGFLAKYQEDLKKVEQAIRTQWAPKLKEKERQMSARLGQDVRLDPMKDPEFAAFYKQNVENLRARYAETLEGAKAQLASICGFSTDDA